MSEFPFLLLFVTLALWVWCVQREGGIGIGIRFLYLNTILQQFLAGPFLYTISGLAESDPSFANRSPVVELGCYAIIAFVLGGYVALPLLVGRPLLVDVEWRRFASPVRLGEQFRAGRLLTLVGLCALPAFRFSERIQTLRAIMSQLTYLIDVGVVMMMLSLLLAKDRRRYWIPFALLAVAGGARTLFTGFFGPNMRTGLLLVMLVLMLRKCRLRSWLYLAFTFYLAIIPYTLWMSVRSSLRQSILYKQSLTERMWAMHYGARLPSLVSPVDEEMAEAIQARIDYSHLMAAALHHTPAKEPFAWGATIFGPVVSAPIPRFVWPAKPILAGGSEYVSQFTGLEFQGVSVATNYLFEFYVNFGLLGVLVGAFVLGLLFGYVEFFYFRNAPNNLACEWTVLLCMITLAGGFDRLYLLAMTLPVDLFLGWSLAKLFLSTGWVSVRIPGPRRASGPTTWKTLPSVH